MRDRDVYVWWEFKLGCMRQCGDLSVSETKIKEDFYDDDGWDKMRMMVFQAFTIMYVMMTCDDDMLTLSTVYTVPLKLKLN